jgi:hypothetical protein
MEYIIDKNIRLSNNSWGGGGYSQGLYDVIEASQAIGHVFVAAAGNACELTDQEPHYPSAFDLPNIISVAATDNDDGIAYFSNFGPASVDLGAPGVQIYSTSLLGLYRYANGTSMAAPHVTGVVALLMSRRPDLTWQQVKDRVLSAVRPVDSLIGFSVTGGVVNAKNVGDCNGNGIDDEYDISGGTSSDCSGNGIPDECESDCNGNGTADSCDVFAGTSEDCNGDWIPDECSTVDCNGNGVADFCDLLAGGTSNDCNANAIPDECELSGNDCNGNANPDECDLADGTSEDCNYSSTPDECELLGNDCDGNAIPDECDVGLRIAVVSASPSERFLTELEDAGYIVTRPRYYSQAFLQDVIVFNMGNPSVESVRDDIDEFVDDGGGLMVVQVSEDEEHFAVQANPVMDIDGWILREDTQVIDFDSPLVSGHGPASTLTGYSTNPGLRPEAETVINWADGVPMAVTYRYGEGHVVYFNDSGVMEEDDYWAGDEAYGTSLMHNAFNYLFIPPGDCNLNRVPDACDIAGGVADDDLPPGGDGIPDECQSDCNENMMPDAQDIADEVSRDCNVNGVPDECDLASETSTDCDGNQTLDECDPYRDCNNNGRYDSCDLLDGASQDENYNGVPDECDVIIFVDADASGTHDGASWATAYDDLQDALAETTATEIWIAAGTYKPAAPGGDLAVTFLVDDDLRIFGGFDGSETRIDQRDPAANRTILSGDLNGDDSPDHMDMLWQDPTREDNSYHVLTVSGSDTTALLDGLVLTAGNAYSPAVEGDRGGGLSNYRADVTVIDCVFVRNAARNGGGADNFVGHNVTFINCRFIDNAAYSGGGLADIGTATLINCVFDGNYAMHDGAGVFGIGSAAHTTLTNCTFVGNRAREAAGLKVLYADATLSSCVFWDNIADEGTVESAQITLGGQVGETVEIDYSCVQGWTGDLGGVGNIGEDPLFVDADGADDIQGTEDDNPRLSAGSSCIDAGDNLALPFSVTTDLGGGFRRSDDTDTPDTGRGAYPIVDIGAYELQKDCNDNGIGDGEEILNGTIPDCNGNSVPDECDIADGTSADGNGTGVPDECEDCNENGIMDLQDVADGTSADCNANSLPDECDTADGTSPDCNSNSIPDGCEVENDCNGNGLPDECDCWAGTSEDLNDNDMPDECEGPMNRYIALVPGTGAEAIAYQVTLKESLEFPESAGLSWWVAVPDEDGVSRLATSPVFHDWSDGLRLIHVGDCQIVPASTYEIRATPDGVSFGDPVELPTVHRPEPRYYGDVVGVGTGEYPPRLGFTPPNGAANVSDVQAFLLTVQGANSPSAPTAWVDLHGLGEGTPPNFILNVADLQRILFGVEGQRYADAPDHLDPADCP